MKKDRKKKKQRNPRIHKVAVTLKRNECIVTPEKLGDKGSKRLRPGDIVQFRPKGINVVILNPHSPNNPNANDFLADAEVLYVADGDVNILEFRIREDAPKNVYPYAVLTFEGARDGVVMPAPTMIIR